MLEGAARSPPTPASLASFRRANAENLLGEEAAIAAQVDQLLSLVPPALLLGDSRVPPARQLSAKRDHLLGFGVGTLQGAHRFLRDWVAFCTRQGILDCGVPISEELFLWFLNEADAAARSRATGSRTGESVKHGLAAAARFLCKHAGLPFGAAQTPQIRGQSATPRSRDPAWAEMWEVATLPHLLRLACCYRGHGASMVRVYAFGTYLVITASLRLVDGLRSAPPVLSLDSSGHMVLRSVAALTKGKRRSTMQPLPWVVPLVSVDTALSDDQVVAGVRETLTMYPSGACSLFPPLCASGGRAAALGSGPRFASEFAAPAAGAAGATAGAAGAVAGTSAVDRRATPAHLASSVCYLLCWSPLGLSG